MSDTKTNPGNEPIAIVGMGCRFPGGVNNPAEFWQLLAEGRDAVGIVPPGRWNKEEHFHPDPKRPGKIYSFAGGYLADVGLFDAGFFGISPVEAARMDPQQRILLEVVWETLEDAGIVVERLRGTRTGVYIGASGVEYREAQSEDPVSINAYTNTGISLSLVANRISHAFDLQGPSMTIDTACSSALVAVHTACRDIWSGDVELALAGAANLILSPWGTVGFCRASMLSPTGHCYAFDARADGFVRAEGFGIVALKPLSRAVAAGDKIHAVIVATGVNQDGRTTGISLPSAEAQEKLLREVYDKAGIPRASVPYVEAHGTGTAVGDPLECTAIGNAMGSGAGRAPGDVCRIGSVKPNLGHLEAAAGIASLMKMTLALEKRQMPATILFETPNPKIDFAELGLKVQATLEAWPENAELRAGIASFGFGGTNAHVALKGAPEHGADAGRARPGGWHVLPFSGRGTAALKARAAQYRDWLSQERENNGEEVEARELYDFCYTAAVRRDHHSHRAAVAGRNRAELVRQLDAWLSRDAMPRATKKPRVAFVFSGNGPQWWGMARQLMESEPVFAQAVRECDAETQKLAGWSVLEEMRRDEAHSRMGRTDIAQPALFAVQVGLLALWRSWGVEPEATLGHSVGEIAAAYAAGIVSFADAVKIVHERSRTQELTAGSGGMAAVGLSTEKIAPYLAEHGGKVGISAFNGPDSVTLSGDKDALQAIIKPLADSGIFCRLLPLNYAFHSPHMEQVREDLTSSLGGIAPRAGTIRFISTVTGGDFAGEECGAHYWWRNIREPVNFSAAVETLLNDGVDLFLEIGPHPVLLNYVDECASRTDAAKEGKVREVTRLHSLRRKENDFQMILGALGSLYAAGYPVDWRKIYQTRGMVADLPFYPWQRERHWNELEKVPFLREGKKHPLLGQRVESPQPYWSMQLDHRVLPYLLDHRVQGSVVVPGAACVEMATAAAAEFFGEGTFWMEDLELKEAIVIEEGEVGRLQFTIAPDMSFTISGQPANVHEWKTHATGRIAHDEARRQPDTVSLAEIQARCTRHVSKEMHYRRADTIGLQFGPAFQGAEEVHAGDREVLGRIVAPGMILGDVDEYFFHPALLDACTQILVNMKEGGASNQAYIPVGIKRARIYRKAGAEMVSHAYMVRQEKDILCVSCRAYTETGETIAELDELRLQRLDLGAVSGERARDCLYEYRWLAKPFPEMTRTARDAAVLPGPAALVKAMRAQPGPPLFKGADVNLEGPGRSNLMCALYVTRAFSKLGWQPVSGERIVTGEFMQRLGIAARHDRVVERLFELLEAEQIVKSIGDGVWEFLRLPEGDPDSIWKGLLYELPAFHSELALIRQCGENLAEVFTEKADALELIFPEKSGTAEHFYSTSPSFGPYNALMARLVAKLVAGLPATRGLRILEIGGGTGGATSYILPHLPAERTSYLFTDMSPLFLARASQRFEQFDFLEYRLLDIGKDPLEQGYDRHGYDLIIASDVLHATTDLRVTFSNVKQLLASEGMVVMLESNRASRWVDLVFGLLKDWWLYKDTDVRSHPLMNWPEWEAFLRVAGFRDVERVMEGETAGDTFQALIAARGPRILEETPSEPPSEERGLWLLFADGSGLADTVARRLEARGQEALKIHRGEDFEQRSGNGFVIRPGDRTDMDRMMGTLSSRRIAGIVHCWAVDETQGDAMTPEHLEASQDWTCLSLIQLVQSLTEIYTRESPRLWLVTSEAQPLHGHAPVRNMAQTPVVGMGRTIMKEFPDLRCSLADMGARNVDGAFDADEVRNLVEGFFQDEHEEETALRGEMRYVNRLAHLPRKPTREVEDAGENYRLVIDNPGDLSTLALQSIPRANLKPEEIEIETVSVGLNFKDVMLATGLLKMGGGISLGLECAGRITRVGAGVNDLRPGDEVVALGGEMFGPYVMAGANLVARKPRHISFDEAATIPSVFLTSYHALVQLARLQKGERVLIHAAAGGVGLSAIQIAQEIGAEVFATAGSWEKRGLLKALGVKHVMDSRTTAFASRIMEITGGEGVDVVLNSLGGEAIPRNLDVLRPFGRYIEIGKRDLALNSRVGLKPFEKCLSFHSVDLDQLMRLHPARMKTLFNEVMERVERNAYRPLPYRVFPLQNAAEAFRCMQQGRHTGKIVISTADKKVRVRAAKKESLFREDATYLITGGLGGFGLEMARWMITHGARHLALTGRRGLATPGAEEAIRGMRDAGVGVEIFTTDAGVEEETSAMFAEIARKMPPLRGIVHAALVLEDGIMLQLNRERLMKVLRPRMLGVWHLHRLSLGLPLDYFIAFSSVTSLLGNGGQSNYAASGTFIDALAHHRRARGLPGLSINWGPILGAGYLARGRDDLIERFQKFGVNPMSVPDSLEALGTVLESNVAQAGVVDINWRKWTDSLAVGSSRLAMLAGGAEETGPAVTSAGDFRSNIKAANPTERRNLVAFHLCYHVARVLGTCSSKVEVDKPITSMGLDSLMAVDLRIQIERDLNVDVPVMSLMQGQSVDGLTGFLLQKMEQGIGKTNP